MEMFQPRARSMATKTLAIVPMTADEFAQMQTAETEDYELVDGELIPLPSELCGMRRFAD